MSAARKLAQKARAADTEAAKVVWPSLAWRGRHLEFARDVLGKRTIARHQRNILDEYYSAGRIEIVVCTGQKLGKTEDLIIILGMDWATEPRLNGFIMGPKIDWIDEGLWPRFVVDILNAYYPCAECMPAHRAWCALVETDPWDETPRPERCPNCSPLIPSTLKNPKRPEEGRKSDWLDEKSCEGGLRDVSRGRAIRGYTARKEGGKGGFSGNVRFYFDESSDISDTDRETVRGNMSGGGKFIAFGNLLYLTGWFYRAFTRERGDYSHVLQMSSRRSPNCRGKLVWSDGVKTPENDNNDRPIPGMATPDDIESNLRAWKKGGQNYIDARIDAKAPTVIEGQLADLDLVAAAEKRWTPSVETNGVLQLGVDVARMRDKLAIAVRRGNKIVELFAEVLNQKDHVRGVEIVLEYGTKYRGKHERKPRLVFDESGPEGQAFHKELLAQKANEVFDIYPVQMGAPPRNRKRFDKRRDELAQGFAEWLRHGAIPANANLEAQLEVTTGKNVEVSYGSKGHKWTVLRVVTNDELRPHLDGESPDERNACELAAWDVDGTETTTLPPDAETNPGTPQAKRAAPANNTNQYDEFEGVDMADRLDMFMRHTWGQS
jgi:hypothetical protein